MGIIAGFGRGMPGRPAGGRGGRSPSTTSSVRGGGTGREPMPWLGANGLLPGRGAPGRAAGRGAGVGVGPSPSSAAGASGAGGSSTGASTTAAGVSTTSGACSSTGGAAAAFLAGLGPGLAVGAFSGAAAGASAAGADALEASSASPYAFLNFISTGSSMVEEGDLTNSPSSFSFSRTSLLSMP